MFFYRKDESVIPWKCMYLDNVENIEQINNNNCLPLLSNFCIRVKVLSELEKCYPILDVRPQAWWEIRKKLIKTNSKQRVMIYKAA